MNPVKGEVGFTVAGEAYTLILDYNCLCSMEAEIPGNHGGDLEAMLRGPTNIRTAIWLGLQARHEGITPEAVGRLITELGVPRIQALLKEGLKWAFPDPSEGDVKTRPLKAAARRNAPSTKITT